VFFNLLPLFPLPFSSLSVSPSYSS
jgi:hypothetical protein